MCFYLFHYFTQLSGRANLVRNRVYFRLAFPNKPQQAVFQTFGCHNVSTSKIDPKPPKEKPKYKSDHAKSHHCWMVITLLGYGVSGLDGRCVSLSCFDCSNYILILLPFEGVI
jgi:hypothetical protein